MLKLIKFESKKVFTDSAVKYFFLLLIVWIMFSTYNTISMYSFASGERQDSLWFAPYEGIKAIKFVCKNFYNYETEFSVNNLRDYGKFHINHFEKFYEEAERKNWTPGKYNAEEGRAFAKLNDLYPIDLQLFYLDADVEGVKNINRINEAVPDDLYNKLFNIRAYQSSPYNTKENNDLVYKQLKNIKTPYKYLYCEGWKVLNSKLQFFHKFLPIIIFMIFILILKYDQESGMQNFILTTKYGRTKVVYAKIISAILITIVLYTLSLMIYSLSILSIFGFKGWNVQIQAVSNFHTAIYNLNLLSFFILQYLMGLLLSIFTVLLGFFIFSVFQNYIVSLLSSVFIIYAIPLSVSKFSNFENNLLAKYINMLGVKILSLDVNFCGIYPNNDFIYFFGSPILRAYGLLIVYSILSIIFIELIIFNYKKMEITK